MTIVDTSVWVDYLHGKVTAQTDWLKYRARPGNVGLTNLLLTELLQGVCVDSNVKTTRNILMGFSIFDTGGSDMAIASADHYRWLRKRGITIRSTIDCLTATFCIREGHSLLHNDRDFDPFEKHFGLKVIHPQA